MRRIDILGVGVHDCDEEEAVGAIEGFLSEEPPRLHQVATVNPEFVMEARGNPAFRELLNTADLATPDGVGIVLAARLSGTRLKGRVTGVAMVDRLAEMSARQGCRIFLLGAAPGVAEDAAREMARRHAGVRIAGTYAGSPRDSDWPGVLERIEIAQPDVLLVAYGAPRQDLWIRQHRDALPAVVRVAMGVGGVFDYLSGRVPLAPAPLRRLGLEWLYRLSKQPWRWRRIIKVFHFGAIVLVTVLKRRGQGSGVGGRGQDHQKSPTPDP